MQLLVLKQSEAFSENDISLTNIIANSEDITLLNKIWIVRNRGQKRWSHNYLKA